MLVLALALALLLVLALLVLVLVLVLVQLRQHAEAAAACVVRDSNSGHQLLLTPANCCPMFALWTTHCASGRSSCPASQALRCCLTSTALAAGRSARAALKSG